MSRLYNFSPGPSMLPQEVLEAAQQEMIDWNQSGMSVMEMSHRGKEYTAIAQQAEADLRQLMAIPDHYKVLFLQGGATAQFSAVPLNLLRGKKVADYVNTGMWSKKAIAEARRYCDVNIAATSEASGFTHIPDFESWSLSGDAAAYVHYTPNETIGGVEFHWIPETGDVPLVADMSSTILSRPIDVSKFGLIYAGAQKNMGPAGITVVIVRDDLIGDCEAMTPSVMNYKTMADADSMSNTPPTYSWYLAGKVFRWALDKGGLDVIAEINKRKAAKLYAAIDDSGFYANPIAPEDRSLMNVPFTLKDATLDAAFLAGAKEAGLATLKGHRSLGGMRASIYNAMPESGVDALVEYMKDFASKH